MITALKNWVWDSKRKRLTVQALLLIIALCLAVPELLIGLNLC